MVGDYLLFFFCHFLTLSEKSIITPTIHAKTAIVPVARKAKGSAIATTIK